MKLKPGTIIRLKYMNKYGFRKYLLLCHHLHDLCLKVQISLPYVIMNHTPI